MKEFYTSYQNNTMSYESYMDPITNLREVIVHCGGSLGDNILLIDKKLKEAGVELPYVADITQIENKNS